MARFSEIDQLRELLLAPEVSALINLERSLDALEHEIHDPAELSRLLAPVIAEVVHRGDPALSMAIIRAITPLLDRALKDKVLEDPMSVSAALAPASTGALALHYAQAPQAAAHDLAPLMSAAIKEEIRGERDAMIDALYPIIGSTISKYLSETMATLTRTINEKIESRLSFGTLGRKLRAQFMGVTEAELLLKESLPLRVDAAFLIHKSSGLVIAQFQNPQLPSLDPNLLSGMLTAIRSFFNESMNGNATAHELDQIEYGESKIVLEVAGYCYLAAIVRGTPDDSFRQLLRTTMASIIEQHGSVIAAFAGNSGTVPEDVSVSVQEVVRYSRSGSAKGHSGRPYGVILAGCILLLALGIPLGIHMYRNYLDGVKESRTVAALRTALPVPLSDVNVVVDRETLHLSGRVSNEFQRDKAAKLAATAAPGMTVDNRIVSDPAPPFTQLTTLRVKEVVSTLSTIDGVYLDSKCQDGDLVLTGAAADSSLAEKIARTFQSLPGLRAFDNRVAVGDLEISRRLHFAVNSSDIRPGDRTALDTVKTILDRTPWSLLQISGYSDDLGSDEVNRRIALGRAVSAESALLALGIPPQRIRIQATPGPPPGVAAGNAHSVSRCVRFELLRTNPAGAR
jgi:outer membrane protein OmpA-like peptidoglycan-associated protein